MQIIWREISNVILLKFIFYYTFLSYHKLNFVLIFFRHSGKLLSNCVKYLLKFAHLLSEIMYTVVFKSFYTLGFYA